MRLDLVCLRERHRRGRKVGTSLKTTGKTETRGESQMIIRAKQREESFDRRGETPPGLSSVKMTSPHRDHGGPRATSWIQSFWANADGFQPCDLLQKPEEKGRASLQTILSGNLDTEEGSASAGTSYRGDEQLDPIAMGLLNRHMALSLFDEHVYPR